MLRVVHEATTDLAPGLMAEISETRGLITIKLREGAVAKDCIPFLNDGLKEHVDQCRWFQIWRGQIISADSPDSPLTIQYVPDPDVPLRLCVQLREDRGAVRLHVNPNAPTELLARVLNVTVDEFLAGGQWFQLWQGEIVTIDDDCKGNAAA